MENKYDNEIFFEKYSNFPRSIDGLNAAGEWYVLKTMLPDFHNKRVLDLGCGFGWHCLYAAENGATSILGIDISEKMLAKAKEKNSYSNIKYKKISIENFDSEPNSFDIVISSLAFHYIENFNHICQKVAKVLSPKGYFVFSVEHPIFTAQGKQDWIYTPQGNKKCWPVDNYFEEGKRDAVFLGEHVTKYHHTLTTYINTLLQNGFSINSLQEPQPSPQMLATIPDMKDELRRPMMLLISAMKTA